MANGALDKYCGSEFWNWSVTWETDDPDLTRCFEKTVLVWIPCLFLWTFASLEVYYILTSKKRDIPWNFLNVSKIIVTSLLILLSFSDLIINIAYGESDEFNVYNVDIYTPIIKLLSFCLSLVLLIYNVKNGLRTSGLQFIFWLLCALCGIPQMRTEIRQAEVQEPSPFFPYVSYLIYYPLVVVMLFLNCWADKPPRVSFYTKKQAKPCPEEGSSFLSRLLFSYFDPLAWVGYRRPLVETDLWDLKPEDSSEEVVPLFEKYWQKTVEKVHGSPLTVHNTEVNYKSEPSRVEFTSTKKKKQASILPAMVKAFGPTFLFGALLKLSQDVLTFVSPQILKLLIAYVEQQEEEWKGYFYALLLFFTATIQTIVLAQYFNRMFIVGMRIRTALVAAIYRKALRMSNAAKKESTVGEIVNLMSVDAQKFIDLTAYLNMIWSAPLQIILALYFLWDVLGPSVLAGLAVMIILIPINGYIANRVKVLQIRQMKNKDERVKLMNEVLSGIKVLKLYAWEPSFEEQVLKIRTKEVKVLKQAAYLNAGTSFIWSCAPFLVTMLTFTVYLFVDDTHTLTPQRAFVAFALFDIMRIPMSLLPLIIVYAIEVSLVTFGTYVLVDENNVLTAKTAFVSLSLFNILRFPLSMLPMMISNMVQAGVSIKRINKFMNCEELDPGNVTHDPSESAPLLISNGTFSWGDDPVLKNINLRLQKNTLTAVVGPVGSGKSSLISAFLGEMEKRSGRVNTVGKIAYVSQQAWIQNATLQDNILFGKPLNKTVYNRVIEACALKPDFDMLPAGDQTEIGEKGINLSGGQKQRVSLARAVYADADVYFLDDPLSAVDSHVGKHIFEQVIGPNGLLKGRTRVLVTHGITYLPQTHKIVVLKNGEVSEIGSYQELLDKKGDFSEFLTQHMNDAEEEEEEVGELRTSITESSSPERSLLRHRSRDSESSERANGSLQRQKSSDSSRSLRQRSVSIDDSKKDAVVGEKLIEIEKTETGSVKWTVYKHYLKSIGLFLTCSTILLNMIFQGFSIGSNIWLSQWSSDNETIVNGTVNTAKRDMYLGVYGALGVGQALSIFVSSLALYVGTLNGAHLLHDLLLKNMLRAPCTSFYDVTPVGRILNRFSKDVDTLDNVLPMTIRGWMSCFFAVFFAHTHDPLRILFSALSVSTLAVAVGIATLVAATRLHKTMLHGIMHAPLTFFDTTPVGRILARFASDVETLDDEFCEIFQYILDSVLEVIATLVVISYTSTIFMSVILPIGILYYLIQRFYVATSRQLKRLESVSRSPIYSHFGETVTGVSAIRAFGQQDRFIKESEHRVDVNQVCYYPGVIANRWLAVRLEMIGNLIIFFAALFAVLQKDQLPGLVGLSVSYALQVTQTLNWLVRMTSDVETNIVAVERIKEYGETPQEAPWEIPNKTPSPSWPDKGEVHFRNYAVRYRPGLDLVLKGVNFTVNGSEKVGIVGRTGAGKSSLTLGLFRIIEAAEGEIVIDNVNISTIGLHALRSRLTIIPQDAILFSGSLRFNLDPFDKYSDDEIWTALELAHLKGFVKGLPAGLNHEVSEGGENLSVGQRQLICLTRALLRKSKVLILDEATAAVDLETDDLIQRTIRTEFKNCTILTIAHRLNTILDSDRVIVLDKGNIVEFDSPANLMLKKDSVFYGMCKDAGLV